MALLKPDYSATVKDVFLAATIACLKADSNLRISETRCAESGNDELSLPSWCFDWSRGGPHCAKGMIVGSIRNVVSYQAGSRYGPHFEHDPSIDVLTLRGVAVDEVDTTFCGSFIGNIDLYEVWSAILEALKLPDNHYIDDLVQVFCQTIVKDTFERQSCCDPDDISKTLAWLRQFQPGMQFHDIDWPKFREEDVKSPIQKLMKDLASFGAGRSSVFRTEAGGFGKSCSHVVAGDSICILYGGEMPLTLREVGVVEHADSTGTLTKQPAYRLVGGGSYVHGLMNGEGLDIAEREGLEVEDFCLI